MNLNRRVASRSIGSPGALTGSFMWTWKRTSGLTAGRRLMTPRLHRRLSVLMAAVAQSTRTVAGTSLMTRCLFTSGCNPSRNHAMHTLSTYVRSALIRWNSAQQVAAVRFPCWIFWNFSKAISSASTWPKAFFMLVFSSSYVRLIPPSWFRKVSTQFHATPWSREDAYPVFFSSSSNRFPSVLNFSSH